MEPSKGAWHSRLLALSRGELADRTVTANDARAILVALNYQESRVDVLGYAVEHVLRYGKIGKQSRGRLKAAMHAVGWKP